jgi:uncharacterized protein (DUF2236 family)
VSEPSSSGVPEPDAARSADAAPGGLPEAQRALLERALPGGLPPGARGLFRDDSAIRRLGGESVLLFGGGCALLLEVAHPLVAAGVARHSSFRTDPMGRLRRTLDAVNDITFADLPAALRAAQRIERAHVPVRGRLGFSVAGFGADAPYDGRDPALVRWVWATLAWTSLRVYERFVRPLDAEEVEAFYTDHQVVARAVGTPPEMVPSSYAAFEAWFDGLVEGGELAVTDEARAIAEFILHPPAATPGGGLVRSITAWLLPAPVRESFGLPWSEEKAERLERYAASVRALRRG